jgi:hypothetical protein
MVVVLLLVHFTDGNSNTVDSVGGIYDVVSAVLLPRYYLIEVLLLY